MRRLLGIAALAGCALIAAIAVVSCVGDDPTPNLGQETDSGGVPDTGTAPDTGGPNPGVDAGTDTGAAQDASVSCLPGQPQNFAPIPNTGPFCQGAGANNHCAVGEHCCRNNGLNTQSCAASCSAGVIDIACFNAAECAAADAGAVCCAKGIVRLDVCTYAVVDEMQSTKCAASCSNEFQACAANGECSGKTCTPTRVLSPDGKSTSLMQISACL